MLLTLCTIILTIVCFRFIFEIMPVKIKNLILYYFGEVVCYSTQITGMLLTGKPIYSFFLEFCDEKYNIKKPKDPEVIEAIATTHIATIALESANMEEFKKIVQHIIDTNNKLTKRQFSVYKSSMLYVHVKYFL